jgi:hypothetical protein
VEKMQSIKISDKTKTKIQEKQAQLLLKMKKKIGQAELLEKIVLAAVDDPDFMARILEIDQFPSIEQKKEVLVDLVKKPSLAPAPLMYEDEWED